MESFGYVYRVTNLINGKTYVGQRTSARDTSWIEYLGSGSLIKAAVTKYGRDNFSKVLLLEAGSRVELDKLEHEAIKAEWRQGRGEYNMRSFVPSPVSWLDQDPESLAETKRLQIESRRENAAKNSTLNGSARRAKARWEAFCARVNLDAILKLYSEENSVLRVSRIIDESPKHIDRLLRESDLLNKPRTTSESRSESDRIAISEALLLKTYGFPCGICSDSFSLILCKNHRSEAKKKSRIGLEQSVIHEMVKLGSMRAVARKFRMNPSRVKKILTKNGYETPSQSNRAAVEANRMKKFCNMVDEADVG